MERTRQTSITVYVPSERFSLSDIENLPPAFTISGLTEVGASSS